MKNKNTNSLITGITGFLGSLIAKNLIHTDAYRQGSIKIIGLARNIEKAQVQFADYDMRNVSFHSVDITDKDKMFSIFKEQHIDYMIHCAAATASSYMVSHPIETADGIVLGTRNMLELARRMQVKSMVYLSSMEAYGRVTDIGRPRKEEELGDIDITSPRSCYPLGKRMAEHYCHIYYKEYGVPVKVARLSQTFGEGVRPEDKRVFMQFARSAMQYEDIVLKTQGLSVGNYCDSTDAVNAVMMLLHKGENGEIYNVVNEENTMTIRQMAQLVSDRIAGGRIQVRVEAEDTTKTGYAPDTALRMSAEKLRLLGWRPTKNLEQMYRDVIQELEKSV